MAIHQGENKFSELRRRAMEFLTEHSANANLIGEDV
jgi:hypothetical protein